MRRMVKSVTYSWFEENFIKNFSNANIPEFDTSVWIYWGYQTSRIGEIGMIQGKLKVFFISPAKSGFRNPVLGPHRTRTKTKFK